MHYKSWFWQFPDHFCVSKYLKDINYRYFFLVLVFNFPASKYAWFVLIFYQFQSDWAFCWHKFCGLIKFVLIKKTAFHEITVVIVVLEIFPTKPLFGGNMIILDKKTSLSNSETYLGPCRTYLMEFFKENLSSKSYQLFLQNIFTINVW